MRGWAGFLRMLVELRKGSANYGHCEQRDAEATIAYKAGMCQLRECLTDRCVACQRVMSAIELECSGKFGHKLGLHRARDIFQLAITTALHGLTAIRIRRVIGNFSKASPKVRHPVGDQV